MYDVRVGEEAEARANADNGDITDGISSIPEQIGIANPAFDGDASQNNTQNGKKEAHVRKYFFES